MKENLKSCAYKLRKHYGCCSDPERTDQAHAVYSNEADTASSGDGTDRQDAKHPDCLQRLPPAHETEERSESVNGQRGCEQHLSCDRVLFVERSGELRVQEWLRA